MGRIISYSVNQLFTSGMRGHRAGDGPGPEGRVFDIGVDDFKAVYGAT